MAGAIALALRGNRPSLLATTRPPECDHYPGNCGSTFPFGVDTPPVEALAVKLSCPSMSTLALETVFECVHQLGHPQIGFELQKAFPRCRTRLWAHAHGAVALS